MKRNQYPKNDFPSALKIARESKGKSQESFGLVSSRTYVSTLERGLYSPTLNKVDQLAEVLDLHPLSLITLAYMTKQSEGSIDLLLERVQRELASIKLSK